MEDTMKLKVAQVIGLNTDQKAAQVISSPQDADNSFFAVLELKCDDAFTKGRQALTELSDFYFDFEKFCLSPESVIQFLIECGIDREGFKEVYQRC